MNALANNQGPRIRHAGGDAAPGAVVWASSDSSSFPTTSGSLLTAGRSTSPASPAAASAE